MTIARTNASKSNGSSRLRQKLQSLKSGERFSRFALLLFPVLVPIVLFSYLYHPLPTRSQQLSTVHKLQLRHVVIADSGGKPLNSASIQAEADIQARNLRNFVDPDFFATHPTLKNFLLSHPLPHHSREKETRELEVSPDGTRSQSSRDDSRHSSSGNPLGGSTTLLHHPPTVCIALPSSPRPFRASTKKKPWHLAEQVLRSLNARLSNTSVFNASNMRMVVYSSGCTASMGQAGGRVTSVLQGLARIIEDIFGKKQQNGVETGNELGQEESPKKRTAPRWIQKLSARDRQSGAVEGRHARALQRQQQQQQQQQQHGDSELSPDTNHTPQRRLLAKTDNRKLPPDMQFDKWTEEERARFVLQHTEHLEAVAAELGIPTVVLPPREDACGVVDPRGTTAPLLTPYSFSGAERVKKWGWQAKLALDFIYATRQCALMRPDLVLTLQDDVEPVHGWDFGIQEFMDVDLPSEGKTDWSMLSLYAPRSYGWRIKHGQQYNLPCCAQALLFNASSGALDDLLTRMEGTFSSAPMDHQVRDWLEGSGRKAYVHAPSLFQHVGTVRTKTVGVDASAFHQDPTFLTHILKARRRGERATWAMFDPTVRARAVNQIFTPQ